MMLGPHFFVFPSADELGTSEKSVYNCLSEWNKAVHESFLPPPIPYVCFPFGVEMPPLSEKPRTKVLLYYKHRVTEDLAYVEALLNRRGVAYTVIHYGHYRSEDYASLLDESQYMVVVDAHESQGFALCEALARNVPLLVYDVTSMKQEYVGRFHYETTQALAASSVPYWDARCGERTTDPRELDAALTQMQSSLPRYRPREFIQEKLSDEACFQRLFEFVQL
jgi:glycosyltransferase involved in cell wall biosynthesis